MTHYKVRGVRHIESSMVISADTPQEAAKKFRENYRGYRIDMVTDQEDREFYSLDTCEGCEAEIFEGDYHCQDEDGLRFCKVCCEKAREAAE